MNQEQLAELYYNKFERPIQAKKAVVDTIKRVFADAHEFFVSDDCKNISFDLETQSITTDAINQLQNELNLGTLVIKSIPIGYDGETGFTIFTAE